MALWCSISALYFFSYVMRFEGKRGIRMTYRFMARSHGYIVWGLKEIINMLRVSGFKDRNQWFSFVHDRFKVPIR